MERVEEMVAGGLIGLLVGDALGVPYEFHPPGDLPPVDAIEFHPPPGFRRAHFGVQPGTWSDDGAQALVLLDSLLANEGLDLAHFAKGLREWMLTGFYAVNRSVFDIGAQTSTAINRLSAGVPPHEAGPSEDRHNGNGSLMRVLPLVLWHRGDDAELVVLAMRQSLPTHGHWRSRICCAQYCLWARAVMHGEAAPWDWAGVRLREVLGTEAPVDELERVLDPANAAQARGSGYVLDTLWSARHAVETTDAYEACVRRAISFGHDTDTTAAVAGGIAGLHYGLGGIPARWREALRGRELVQPLLEGLVGWAGAATADTSGSAA